MYPVNSAVDLGNVNHTELGVGSNGVKTGKASFNEKKIQELQKTLGVNLGMLPKKHAVANGTVFSANIAGNMSFGSKVKQFFENIKLKFWDVSKSISKDCEKLKKLLTEGVTASLRREGGSVTDTLTNLLEDINGFKNKLSSDNLEAQEIKQNLENLEILKQRIGTLRDFSRHLDNGGDRKLQWEYIDWNNKDWRTEWHKTLDQAKAFLGELEEDHPLKLFFEEKVKQSEERFNMFLKHADSLDKFDAFYKEVSVDDREYYEIEGEEYEFQGKKEWQTKQFKVLDEAKVFSNGLGKEHPLKSFFTEKISKIEEQIVGDDQIRAFYETFAPDNPTDADAVAVKCNKLVTTLKSMEQWLTVVDPDCQGTPFLRGNVGERYFRIHPNFPKEDPKNEVIKQQLESYLEENTDQHPKCSVKTYRGIPYIADQKGNPVLIRLLKTSEDTSQSTGTSSRLPTDRPSPESETHSTGNPAGNTTVNSLPQPSVTNAIPSPKVVFP